MLSLLRQLVIPCLVAVILVAGCDDDENGPPGGMEPPINLTDLTAFEGAWFIRTTGDATVFCTGPCSERLEQLMDTYFSIAGAESVCVRIDSLEHLVLVEPFYSEGVCTGSADAQGSSGTATLECEHTGEILGDSLATTISVDAFTQDGGDAFVAIFEVSSRLARDNDCGGCSAIFGMAGLRRIAGECASP